MVAKKKARLKKGKTRWKRLSWLESKDIFKIFTIELDHNLGECFASLLES